MGRNTARRRNRKRKQHARNRCYGHRNPSRSAGLTIVRQRHHAVLTELPHHGNDLAMPMIRHKSRRVGHSRIHRVPSIQIMQMHPGNGRRAMHIRRMSVQQRSKTLQERQQRE